MAPTEQLARGWTFELNTGTVSVPDWVEIHHLDTFGLAGSKVDAETTTGDDDGDASSMVAERGYALTLTGKWQEDEGDGARDAGQEAVEAWAKLKGPDSRKQFRETTPGGSTRTYMATASMSAPGGGGKNDAAKWEVQITRSGSATDSTIGAVPAAPTAVAGTTADDSSVVTWTPPAGTNTMYEVAVVTAAAPTVVVSTHICDSSPFLFAGLTGGTGYKFKVRARNAAGWGPYSALSATVTPS